MNVRTISRRETHGQLQSNVGFQTAITSDYDAEKSKHTFEDALMYSRRPGILGIIQEKN